ncbi:MAG: Flp pilus assembly complex ATPase component TadA [Actinomycetota bacterium]|nr:Flp pilus assembly complex ATPase component TadA [Actinomycetota bacterium]
MLMRGLITVAQLEEARAVAAGQRRSVARVLVDMGLVTENAAMLVLAERMGLEVMDLSEAQFDASAVAMVPEAVARRYACIAMSLDDDHKLVVAMADPANVVAIDDIRALTKLDVRSVVAARSDVMAAITRHYRLDGAAESLVEQATALKDDTKEIEAALESAGAQDAPIIKLVNLLITQAVNDRVSDIHIEPEERGLRVRYRVDGVLHEVMHPPKSVQAGIASRLKIMAEINIAERRIPQDGRIGLVVQGKQIDLRVATLPTVHGEKIVLRILDKSSVLLKLQDLGFAPDNFTRYEKSFRKPYGAILVTGPTGSGKTTTLYATLNILNHPGVNIITVEDPVEYRLAGINQIQTNVKAGLTFASALRSILRADPDIVLIGEIRDQETAQISIEAALTGHLVMSTLHTNDAPSAVTRLTEMGIEPFLVASALDGILAQRLARKLCDRCKEAYVPTGDELASARFRLSSDDETPKIFKPVGCTSCASTGYRGRIALHEVMAVTEEIERLVVERSSADEIAKMAREQGMVPLRDDGMSKVIEGLTSIEEVLRVVV